MRQLAFELQRERGFIVALDIGSGRYGAGRANLENALFGIDASIMLHDPHEKVERGYTKKVSVLSDTAMNRLQEEDVDWVNMSYVLSHASDTKKAVDIVMETTRRFPRAVVTVSDYTLLNRTREEVLNVCIAARP